MSPTPAPAAHTPRAAPARRRVLLWSSLVLLLLIAQSWLVVLTIDFEANRVQDRADAAAIAAAAEVKSLGLQTIRLLQELSWIDGTAGPAADGGARELLRRHREIVRIEWRDVWLGAAVTAVLFTIGKSLIGIYLGRAGVTSVYGAAGSLVLVLLWVYYSSQLLFLGAEFTRQYALGFGSLRHEAQRLAARRWPPGPWPRCPRPRAPRRPRDRRSRPGPRCRSRRPWPVHRSTVTATVAPVARALPPVRWHAPLPLPWSGP